MGCEFVIDKSSKIGGETSISQIEKRSLNIREKMFQKCFLLVSVKKFFILIKLPDFINSMCYLYLKCNKVYNFITQFYYIISVYFYYM